MGASIIGERKSVENFAQQRKQLATMGKGGKGKGGRSVSGPRAKGGQNDQEKNP